GAPDLARRRMGTTLVALVVYEDRAWRVHVGDSRLYRITADRIEQLTDDHNVGTRDIKLGTASVLEAFRSPVGKHLTQAIGPHTSDFVHPDVAEIRIAQSCAFVLCSDGLSDMVPEAALHRIVLEHWEDPQAGVDALVRQANEGGGLDNITAVTVRIDPGSQQA
ncbi:MAG: serine/threonine-protein phosphatase, partial [Cyanobacteria bacterium REEB65]|nr:serine/threonine-protein phosphatase [Cyanobacteria bacterium REEB65]